MEMDALGMDPLEMDALGGEDTGSSGKATDILCL